MAAATRTEPRVDPEIAPVERRRLLAGAPVRERRIVAGGAETVVLEAGAGPPLVLLHGGIECGGAYWGPVIAELAREHRVVVPDVPGLGESAPLSRLDADAVAGWLDAVLAATTREPAILVAHSLLGGLAARFAAERPGVLRRLVVYAAPGIGRYRMPLGLRLVALRFGLRPTERNAERFDRWAFADFDRARSARPEWFRAFTSYTLTRARVPHVKRAMRQLVRAGTRRVPDAELRAIAAPVALIWGSEDRFVSLAFAREASARLGWPLEVVERAGHAPHMERPGAFAAALTSWVMPTEREEDVA